MLKRVLVVLAAIVAIGLVGFGALAWRPSIKPATPPPASSFPAELVARGEVLAGAGNCAACHAGPAGAYAGGHPMLTSFGTIYSTNITPDVETGIGNWSEEAFRRALHEGVARDGSHLFPAFPYDHFTKLTDEDVTALYAYFMTRPAVRAPAHRNTVPFPLNIRALQAGWKLLFFRPGRFEAHGDRSDEWNRGAYLAEGVAHCGACHTPRNALGAEQRDRAFVGAEIDNWIAPPLTKANPSPVPWGQDELFTFLRTGVSRYHGTAAGPMGPVVSQGLVHVPDSDVHAIAVYFADLGGGDARAAEIAPALQRASAANQATAGLHYDKATRLYVAACASCHYNRPGEFNPLRPDLALNSAVNLDQPTNLIRAILFGVDAKQGAGGVVMPGFRTMSDADVAQIAAYLRATRTSKPGWVDLEKKVAEVRKQGPGE